MAGKYKVHVLSKKSLFYNKTLFSTAKMKTSTSGTKALICNKFIHFGFFTSVTIKKRSNCTKNLATTSKSVFGFLIAVFGINVLS